MNFSLRLISLSTFALLLLAGACKKDAAISDSRWLCDGAETPEEKQALDFPNPEASGDPEGYFELYHADGRFEMIDPIDGQSLLGEGVTATYKLKEEDGSTRVAFLFKEEIEGEIVQEEELYEILELSDKRYHSRSVESEEGVAGFESRCTRLGKADYKQ
ncbi:MAG: hypothetical protein CMN76_20705 [Spirochaetaceae bacterium]|nr:hypothetical protein [Spirochaetaceae bacterium]|tara:strand:+ start:134910 stop:135389 length:480 start_codon:yes stop_codon:yes gene_type:complete